MSAGLALQQALIAALAGADGIAGVATGVFDGPPARQALPYLVIGDGAALDWSHKTGSGREHRIAIMAWDQAGRVTRLRGLMAAAGAAIEGLAPDLAGHAIVSVVFLRERIVRDPDGPWAGIVEYRVRTLAI